MHRKKHPEARPVSAGNSFPRARAAGIVWPAVLLLIFVSQALAADAQQKNFRLPQLGGPGDLTLADFHGKVVYLDFWASWCGPCRKSLPLYETLYQEMARQVRIEPALSGQVPSGLTEEAQAGSAQSAGGEFTVLAVNVDEDQQDAVRFLQQHPVSYPVLLDPQGRTAADWQIKVMPSSFLLDRSGAVVKEYVGFEPSHIEEIRHDIQALLDNK